MITVEPVLQIRDVYPGSRIPDPDFYPSRIPDLGSRIQKQQQKRGVKKKLVVMLCSHKFHKIANYFSFGVLKKKNLCQFSKNYTLFTQKNCHLGLKNMGLGSGIQNPRSGIRKKPIPDPGVNKAPDPGSGSATLRTT
jgi:hypothetical protein